MTRAVFSRAVVVRDYLRAAETARLAVHSVHERLVSHQSWESYCAPSRFSMYTKLCVIAFAMGLTRDISRWMWRRMLASNCTLRSLNCVASSLCNMLDLSSTVRPGLARILRESNAAFCLNFSSRRVWCSWCAIVLGSDKMLVSRSCWGRGRLSLVSNFSTRCAAASNELRVSRAQTSSKIRFSALYSWLSLPRAEGWDSRSETSKLVESKQVSSVFGVILLA